MKKILLMIILILANLQNVFAQDATDKSQLSKMLDSYFSIKDGLVNGNSSNAASNAEQFIKTLNSIDYKVISEGNANILLKDATLISETQDIKKQREYFANLSTNMITLAKSVRLTTDPTYKVYCPMKKAYWLSSEQAIKNPYYGSNMLTCGKIEETLK